MNILVMGAGAVGAYFGARLRASGEDVVLCARGENLRAIRERGLDITSVRGDFRIEVPATDQPRDFAPYDLILFCVKAYDTAAAAEAVSGCLKPGGAILKLRTASRTRQRSPGSSAARRSWVGTRAWESRWSRRAKSFI